MFQAPRSSRAIWMALAALAATVAAATAAVVTLFAAFVQHPPVAKIVVRWPAATPQEIDQLVAHPVLVAVAAQPVKIAAVSAYSGEGACTIYLRGAVGVNDDRLLTSVREAVERSQQHLPADAQPPQISLFPPGTRIPSVVVKPVAQTRVAFDRDRLAELGITLAEASGLLDKALGQAKAPDSNAISPDLILLDHQGVAVRLADVAEIFVEASDNFVVRSTSSQAPKPN